MKIPLEPLNKVADALAETVWHKPIGKSGTTIIAAEKSGLAETVWHKPIGKWCGHCRKLFNARRVPMGIFRGSYSSETGGFTQSVRLICGECFRHIREHGISDAMKDEAARDIVNTLVVPGPINAD